MVGWMAFAARPPTVCSSGLFPYFATEPCTRGAVAFRLPGRATEPTEAAVGPTQANVGPTKANRGRL